MVEEWEKGGEGFQPIISVFHYSNSLPLCALSEAGG
jgi:hypothetical protein